MERETCLELALEGERLCKGGDFQGGVAFFEAAIKIGTNDSKNLSAIYSQLGNAYFYLGKYEKALHYHKLDLAIAKSMSDNIGEAKASGNLGNTLKMLGEFEDAAIFCKKHLEIAVAVGDKVGQGRALYNLGNVYHTKGKSLAKFGHQDPGDFPAEVKQCLLQAIEYYERNLELMVQLGDKVAQGRAFGNLGNTHYLLGNFNQAVVYHKERLKIAQEFGDKAAERRAECNLGNAHIFLGEFDKAVKHYKNTLRLAQEIKDLAIEAQACYSLGNTYTLLRDYDLAIQYHLRHLELAQQLRDQVGEGRAFWSIGNALAAVGKHEEALAYATKHLDVSKALGDKVGETTAKRSIVNLTNLLAKGRQSSEANAEEADAQAESQEDCNTPIEAKRNKRFSMEHMEILKLTPGSLHETLDEAAASNVDIHLLSEQATCVKPTPSKQEEDNFLDLLERFQGKRMDDQRCSFDPLENKENHRPDRNKAVRPKRNNMPALHRSISHPTHPDQNVTEHRRNSIPVRNEASAAIESNSTSSASTTPSENCREALFDLIAGLQSRRMDEQRAPLPSVRTVATNGPSCLPGTERRSNCTNNYGLVGVPGNNHNNNNPRTLQRMATTSGGGNQAAEASPRHNRQMSLGASVLPDDDFFEMLMRCQASRLEDQRSALPSLFAASSNGGPSEIARLRSDSRSERATCRPASANSDSEIPPHRGSTVPDDDFFSLILRFQSGRIEDQRSVLPVDSTHKREGSESSGRCSVSSSSRQGSREAALEVTVSSGSQKSSLSKK